MQSNLNLISTNTKLSVLPTSIIDKSGRVIDVSGTLWVLSEITRDLTIKWHKYSIDNEVMEYAFKRYLCQLIKTHSPGTVYTTFHRTVSALTRLSMWNKLRGISSIKETKTILPTLLSHYLQELRKLNRTHDFTYVRAWYQWCTEQELTSFNTEVLYSLLKIKIPGNPQGMAVLSADIHAGPLTSPEIAVLRNALIQDSGPLIERLCLWLSLSYGCNPANFVLLLESDFVERSFDNLDGSFYELNIPRIKKRGLRHKRSEFKTRKIDDRLAEMIKQHIETNKKTHADIDGSRPLLMRKNPYENWIGTQLSEFTYHISTGQFNSHLKNCVRRLNVKSPNTGELLKITPRRLRYSFATAMVQQGASAAELAELLDHSDLQHVRVYYNARSTIVERLDVALAEKLAPLIKAFKGNVIENKNTDQSHDASNDINYQEKRSIKNIHGIGTCGASYICKLYPPLSCYLCEKFQPWRDAPHKKVLNDLIEARENRIREYGKHDHYAKQLDDIIYSVAQVKVICEGNPSGERND